MLSLVSSHLSIPLLAEGPQEVDQDLHKALLDKERKVAHKGKDLERDGRINSETMEQIRDSALEGKPLREVKASL